MTEPTPIQSYVDALRERCRTKYGDAFVADNEELIEVASRNKRQLERFDAEIDGSDLVVISYGTTGQKKEDINPLVKHRNDIAKLYADNLDALMLTPRARYKKQEKRPTSNSDDPDVDYFSTIMRRTSKN